MINDLNIEEVLQKINCDVSLGAEFSGSEVIEIVEEIRNNLRHYLESEFKNLNNEL